VRATITACRERGIEALTLYSFSTENWARPDEEVSGLMALLAEYLQHELAELLENGVRLRAIGELHRLPEEVQMLLGGVVAATSANTGLQLVLALSYGSRAEIVSAVRDLAGQVHRGELAPDEIDDALISSHLYTADLPDPDLLIRTSGELRLSNFLLWQLAYAELYVTEVPWPDFRDAHLDEALASYGCRQRRFGKTGQQVEGA
jgi:undecaprenyl diphosphate synthase